MHTTNVCWNGLALALTLVVASGCMAHGTGETAMLLKLERAKSANLEQRARVAELELRLAELEQQRQRERIWRDQRLMDKLDRLLSLQGALLERSETAANVDSAADEPCGAAHAPESFDEQLRRLTERLRSDPPPWRGGLSREKREALRVLLRQDRALDSSNPLNDE